MHAKLVSLSLELILSKTCLLVHTLCKHNKIFLEKNRCFHVCTFCDAMNDRNPIGDNLGKFGIKQN